MSAETKSFQGDIYRIYVLILRSSNFKKFSIETFLVATLTLVLISVALMFSPLTLSLQNEVAYEEWFKEREAIYESRRVALRHSCIKNNVRHTAIKEPYAYGDSCKEHLNPEHFYLSRKKQLSTCYIYKVASTTIGRSFLKVESNSSKLDHFTKRQQLKPNSDWELYEFKKRSFSFLFVRHPMDRILSCYYEKIYSRGDQDHQDKVKGLHKLVKALEEQKRLSQIRMLPSEIESGLDYANITIPSIQDPHDKLSKKKKSRAKNETASPYDEIDEKQTISFQQFLEIILRIGNDLDRGFPRHWATYWSTCAPCSFDFKVIGHLEDPDDFRYVWRKTGLGEGGPPTIERQSSKLSDADQSLRIQQLKKFYAQIPRGLLINLFKAYKLDFDLFGYDFNEFLISIGKPPLASENNE